MKGDTVLNALSPTITAIYNSELSILLQRGPCTPGTRKQVLKYCLDWACKPGSEAVFWLDGMAGTGKTTVAYSLCVKLEKMRRLGASFFCARSSPECRDMSRIFPSIAYQIARFSPQFQHALCLVLEEDPDAHMHSLWRQFNSLIAKPLLKVRDTLSEAILVVIDALDECENRYDIGQILDILHRHTSDLPIKFLISSRPEPVIHNRMMRLGGVQASILRLALHEQDRTTVQGDIETYLRAALASLNPSQLQLSALVQHAGVLFIYAAAVVRYITPPISGLNTHQRLKKVLNQSSSPRNVIRYIDGMYQAILESTIADPALEVTECEDIKMVLNTVVCARESLSISALSGLLNLSPARVRWVVESLRSILHVTETNELVATLHPSFLDYMLDVERSNKYHCDEVAHNSMLAQLCFDCIKYTEPQFNICRLESSYILDEQIADLGGRVEKAISTELFYACRYWVAHLEQAERSSDLVERLRDFLSARLLLWMEVLNLKQSVDVGVEMLRRAEGWIRVSIR
jgi:hypothetical protein